MDKIPRLMFELAATLNEVASSSEVHKYAHIKRCADLVKPHTVHHISQEQGTNSTTLSLVVFFHTLLLFSHIYYFSFSAFRLLYTPSLNSASFIVALRGLTLDDLPVLVNFVTKALVKHLLYILVFLEYISHHFQDPQVLRAIDSFLGNLPFIKVCIKEKFHDQDPMDVPETLGVKPEMRENTLRLIWEEKLRECYGCDHVKLKLKCGSTYGEHHVSLLDVVRRVASGTNPINKDGLQVKIVDMPPNLSLMEYAKDIVGDQGINPKKGRRNCDFGHDGSFYLTADFDHCCEWVTTHHGWGLSVVLIYEVRYIPPQIPGIDLSAVDVATQQRWKNLVFHSRKRLFYCEVRFADQAEWIYGLEASFLVERDLDDPKWSPQSRSHIQLALKSLTMDFIFNELVVGMVIFPRFK
jgi:hypothetical protein